MRTCVSRMKRLFVGELHIISVKQAMNLLHKYSNMEMQIPQVQAVNLQYEVIPYSSSQFILLILLNWEDWANWPRRIKRGHIASLRRESLSQSVQVQSDIQTWKRLLQSDNSGLFVFNSRKIAEKQILQIPELVQGDDALIGHIST